MHFEKNKPVSAMKYLFDFCVSGFPASCSEISFSRGLSISKTVQLFWFWWHFGAVGEEGLMCSRCTQKSRILLIFIDREGIGFY